MTELSVASEEQYDTLTNAGPLIVLVTAPAWCVPCRRFEPHWEKAQEAAVLDGYTFVKIDAGVSPEDTGSHWASKRFNVMGVPTVFVVEADGTRRDIKARAVVPFIKEVTNG